MAIRPLAQPHHFGVGPYCIGIIRYLTPFWKDSPARSRARAYAREGNGPRSGKMRGPKMGPKMGPDPSTQPHHFGLGPYCIGIIRYLTPFWWVTYPASRARAHVRAYAREGHGPRSAKMRGPKMGQKMGPKMGPHLGPDPSTQPHHFGLGPYCIGIIRYLTPFW